MTAPKRKSRPKTGGRPTRAEASAKALQALGNAPLDVDPLAILRAIANDPSAPATARVAACRELRRAPDSGLKDKPRPADAITERALKILAEKRQK